MEDKKPVFDPGIGNLIIHFETNIAACNDAVGQLKSLHQKKFKFRILYPQMIKLIENNVAFYYGCLLWGHYLSTNFKGEELLNNPFSNLSKEDLEEYDMTFDIDYIINYLEKFEKDSKYFLGKPANISQEWKEILNLYREFIVINDGFKNAKTTDDLKLPEAFTVKATAEQIIKVINEAISTKQLEILLDI